MSVLRRVVAGLVVLGAVVVFGASPAVAGGPTSVMVVAHDRGTAAAIVNSDPAYTNLEKALYESAPQSGPQSSHEHGEVIRVVWYLHDVHAWRVDEIYPDAPGGPWVATRKTDSSGELAETARWHKGGGQGLINALKSLGIFERPVAPPGGVVEDSPAEQDVVPAVEDEPTAAVASPAEQGSGWRWGIPGFFVGALLAAGAVYLLTRSREGRPRADRVQLIDAD
ncbi:hypothetical protein [Kribbella deserti]|uniref:Secreted protein n=1 Tax=Kribbella deserti TaxID=1926257 RepID=A0ABV6QL44_9ACTN